MHRFIIIILLLLLVIYWVNKRDKSCGCSCGKSEHFSSPGYANRMDVTAFIDKTYGGTDSEFKKDPRFGI